MENKKFEDVEYILSLYGGSEESEKAIEPSKDVEVADDINIRNLFRDSKKCEGITQSKIDVEKVNSFSIMNLNDKIDAINEGVNAFKVEIEKIKALCEDVAIYSGSESAIIEKKIDAVLQERQRVYEAALANPSRDNMGIIADFNFHKDERILAYEKEKQAMKDSSNKKIESHLNYIKQYMDTVEFNTFYHNYKQLFEYSNINSHNVDYNDVSQKQNLEALIGVKSIVIDYGYACDEVCAVVPELAKIKYIYENKIVDAPPLMLENFEFASEYMSNYFNELEKYKRVMVLLQPTKLG